MKWMRSESFDIGEGAKVSQAVMDWFQIIGRFSDKHVEDFTGNLLAVNPQHHLAPGSRRTRSSGGTLVAEGEIAFLRRGCLRGGIGRNVGVIQNSFSAIKNQKNLRADLT